MCSILLIAGYIIYFWIFVGLIREYLDKCNITEDSINNYPTDESMDDDSKRLIRIVEDCYYSASSMEKEDHNDFSTTIPAELLMDITKYILQNPVSLRNPDFRNWIFEIQELSSWLENQPSLQKYLIPNDTQGWYVIPPPPVALCNRGSFYFNFSKILSANSLLTPLTLTKSSTLADLIFSTLPNTFKSSFFLASPIPSISSNSELVKALSLSFLW